MANPRKPTALKVLEGTDRADRANPDEPKYAPLDPTEPPDVLRDAHAVNLWHEFAEILGEKGVVSRADRRTLAELCNQQSEIDQIRRSGGQPGPGDKTQLRIMYTEFGMTPASRAKVSGSGDKQKGNAFTELVG